MAQKPTKKSNPVAQPIPPKPPVAGAAPKKASPAAPAMSIKVLCLALAAVCFLLYFNTLWNGYALDDVMVLKENTMVMKGFDGVGELFATPHMRGYLVIPNDMWRPLSLVVFAIEYQFFGANPAIGHFFNIVWFAGSVIMLFLFFNRFFSGSKTALAFLVALLFAVHPVHTEVVANIKSRDELMCFFFAFWALNIYMDYMHDGKMAQLILATVVMFFSFMSKETVVAFLAIIPLLFFFIHNTHKQRAVFIMGSAVLVTFIFVLIRSSILAEYNANQKVPVEFIDNALSLAPSFVASITTKVVILGKYLWLMFIPYPLLSCYSFNSIPFADFASPWFWLSLAANVFIIYIAITRWLKDKKDPWAFGIIFYLATLFLFSNLPFLMGAALAERFAFFASVGACLAVGLAIEKYIIKKEQYDVLELKESKVLLVLVPLMLVYSGLTFARNMDWKNDYTLFSSDAKKSPNDARLHHFAGTAIAESIYPNEPDSNKRKELDKESIQYLRRSLEIWPDYSEAHIELGRIYDRAHQWDSAEVHNVKALSTNPEHAMGNNNLGSVYLATGRYPQAIERFRKCIAINPNFKYAYINIARTFKQLKQYDSAIKHYRTMLTFDPNYLEANQELGTCFYDKMVYDSAEFYFKKVQAMLPQDANATNNVGAVYFNAKRYPEAIEQFKKTIALNPNYVTAYSNMGRSYFYTGQYALAIETFNKELSLNPQNPSNIPFIAMSYQKLGNMPMALKYEATAKQFYSDFKLP